MTAGNISGRRLIQGAIAICFVMLAPRLRRDKPLDDSIEHVVGRRMAEIFGHPDSARRVGMEYLRERPQDADIRVLIRHLVPDPRRLQALRECDRAALGRFLAESTRRDFQRGKTMSVDGWILSETELRVCALSALT